jgi:hypothetical protein
MSPFKFKGTYPVGGGHNTYYVHVEVMSGLIDVRNGFDKPVPLDALNAQPTQMRWKIEEACRSYAVNAGLYGSVDLWQRRKADVLQVLKDYAKGVEWSEA